MTKEGKEEREKQRNSIDEEMEEKEDDKERLEHRQIALKREKNGEEEENEIQTDRNTRGRD